MALSVGHPRGTHSRYVIGCCLIPLEICGVKNNSRQITYGIGCVWRMPSLSPSSSLDKIYERLFYAKGLGRVYSATSTKGRETKSRYKTYFHFLTYPLIEGQNCYCVNLARSQNCYHADHEAPIRQKKITPWSKFNPSSDKNALLQKQIILHI